MAAAKKAATAPEMTDNLFLSGNPKIQKLLAWGGATKEKDKGPPETLYFSDSVVKVNKRGKEQKRAMLITDAALYNLTPGDYKLKRRIALARISAITSSKLSDEFVLHVPEEYDYRFKSSNKQKIFKLLRMLVAKAHGGEKSKDGKSSAESGPTKLAVAEIAQNDLKDVAWTKAQARIATREAVLRRKKELMSVAHESDDEEQAAGSEKGDKDDFSGMLKDSANVTLSDFALLKVIGRGAFGKVMQVKHKSSGKIYAMKILKKKAIIASNQIEHTVAERRILETLTHPFLMNLRFAFQSKEKLYFVLDYYTGGELFFHLKAKRRFPEEVARIYVAEVAAALGHLHAHGIVYRDLKPENILLDNNGHVCLTDFGLAKDVEDDMTHTFCGTPEYIAPEIVTGAGHGKAVDWWGLGILLYELTVGIPPFYSQNVNQMYQKIQHGVLRFPPFLSEDCKAVIVRFLNRDPRKRLGSAKDLEEVKEQPFFKKLDWKKMMKKEIDVPYKPEVKGDDDTANFDQQFTNEDVVDSYVPPSTLKGSGANAFEDFTFVAGKGGALQLNLDEEEDE